MMTSEQFARQLHETCERLGEPNYGYSSRSPIPWDGLPHDYRGFLTTVAAELLATVVTGCSCQTTEKSIHAYGDPEFCAAARGLADVPGEAPQPAA